MLTQETSLWDSCWVKIRKIIVKLIFFYYFIKQINMLLLHLCMEKLWILMILQQFPPSPAKSFHPKFEGYSTNKFQLALIHIHFTNHLLRHFHSGGICLFILSVLFSTSPLLEVALLFATRYPQQNSMWSGKNNQKGSLARIENAKLTIDFWNMVVSFLITFLLNCII